MRVFFANYSSSNPRVRSGVRLSEQKSGLRQRQRGQVCSPIMVFTQVTSNQRLFNLFDFYSRQVVNCDFRLTLRWINFTGHGGTLTKPLLKTGPTAATSATAAAGNNNNSSGKPVKEWYV